MAPYVRGNGYPMPSIRQSMTILRSILGEYSFHPKRNADKAQAQSAKITGSSSQYRACSSTASTSIC
jgi:hypothetical protein